MKKQKDKQKIKVKEIERHFIHDGEAKINAVVIGELSLSSANLPMKDLITYALNLLENKIIKSYLESLSQRKMIGANKSYCG